MPDPIQCRYVMTLEEFITVARQHRRYSRAVRRTLLIFWSISLALLAVGIVRVVNSGFNQFSIAFLIVGSVIAIALISNRRTLENQFAKTPNRNAEFRYQILPNQLICETSGLRIEFAWFRITSFIRTDKGFLVYLHPMEFYWLPFHGFADPADIERANQILAREIPQNPFQQGH